MQKDTILIPDTTRFTSSANGQGFKPLADYIHSKGLKFVAKIFVPLINRK